MIAKESQPNVHTIKLDRSELKNIRDITDDLIPNLEIITEPDFLDILASRSTEACQRMPQLANFLGKLATHCAERVVIVDLPQETIGNLPPTPLKILTPEDRNLFEPDVYRGLIVSMANWYGYGYTSQQNALIHNNVAPVESFSSTAGHSNSAPHELGLHTEDASYNLGEGKDISPDFLTLHYFRNPTEVPTLVSLPDWSSISAKTRDTLREEWFYNRTNPGQGGKNNDPDKPVSVIYGPENDPWLRINTARLDLESYSPKQIQAIQELRLHLEERRINLSMRMGQIAIIDNRRVLHGRPAHRPDQAPKYDGTDRWQRRLTVSNDANRIQAFEDSYRTVNPERVLQI